MERDESAIGIIKALDTAIGQKAFELAREADDGHLCPGHLQFEILKCLFEHREEGVAQSDLEKRLGISKAAVSSAVISMERQGSIERKKSPMDHRVNFLRPTALSEAMFERMKMLHSQANEILTKGISEANLTTFRAVVARMIANLKGEKKCSN